MHPPYTHFRGVSRGAYGVGFAPDSGPPEKQDKRDISDKPDMSRGGYPGNGGQRVVLYNNVKRIV